MQSYQFSPWSTSGEDPDPVSSVNFFLPDLVLFHWIRIWIPRVTTNM